MDSQTQIAALLSGLQADWSSQFNVAPSGIAIKKSFEGDKGIADTIALMGVHANSSKGSSQVQRALQEAGANQAGLSEDQVISRVFSYIKGSIRFVEDEDRLAGMFQNPIQSQELLITPPALLNMPSPSGDCDDFSMLACSMLMAKGIKCDFVTIAANRSQPDEFSHVYCMVRTRDGRNIPFDASHGKAAGWETDRIYRKMVWPVFNWGGSRNGGMGMTVDKYSQIQHGLGDLFNLFGSGGRVYANQFQEGLRARAIGGLGCDPTEDPTCTDIGTYTTPIDVSSDSSSISSGNLCAGMSAAQCSAMLAGSTATSGSVAVTPTPVTSSNGSVNWNSLLPGLFGAVEKVAVQTSQPAGVSTTTCNAAGVCSQSQTVLPAGATSLTTGLSTASISSLLPWIIGAVVIFGGMHLLEEGK